jgi:GNAT superfamily N-acetyltransferase
LEVSNDISNLFRDNREKYRSDDDGSNSFVVVESTRERYDDFKRWHYVTSLPTLHGVYLEVVGKADDDKDDDERNLIGYASFHTEQAPPQFENVVDNLNASKVQRFCVVNRLVVNPKFRGKGVKELLLRAGCDLYHAKGIPCRITTSAYTAKVSLDACKLLAFERFKSRKDTGKERSSGKRKIVVNVPTSTQKCKEADDDNDEKKEREVKRDVLRTLNALTPDSCAKLTPKLRETFDALSENDLTYVSGYVISLARLAPQLRKLLADAVLGTRLENLVRKDAQKEIEKLSTSSSFHLSEEEVSARVRFLNAFVSEMNSEKNAARYLGAKDSALAMTRQDVFTAAKRDMSALRIVEEDSNIFADVKRGQRSGWSYIYIGNPVTRRIDGKNFTFDGETNRFISSSNMLECN